MTWIRTIPISEASDELKRALEAQRALHPIEYSFNYINRVADALGVG
jgi:hypothetical protein